MPILVHLADERERARIKRNGIKIGKDRKGIFCMPVLPNFFISHQWLRELKRNGTRTFIGIYFRIDSKAMVYAGKYNEPHRQIELGEAIKEIMALEDPLGYELIVDRKIEPKEIDKIRLLPQKIGWRYLPHSHLKRPTCACQVCIQRGNIKGRKLRQKLEPPSKKASFDQLLTKLKEETDEYEIDNLLYSIKSTRRRSDPNQLLFLLERKSNSINQSLALALGAFRHENTKKVLQQLLKSTDEDTREFSTDSFLNLYGIEAEIFLKKLNDPAINQAIEEWKRE
ncbi:hypothetical protein ACX0G9_12800 [Flavitalea flava]